jgi:uncharacterized membrane protein
MVARVQVLNSPGNINRLYKQVGTKMLDQIIHSSLSEQLIVFILAAIPVSELRGALPVGMEVFGLNWFNALILSILGNILPVPFLLLGLNKISQVLGRTTKGRKFIEWLYQRTRRQSEMIKKYRHPGLIIFVAIPFPGTGAWTASIAAHLLGIRFWPALLDITLGIIGAGLIVLTLVLLGWIGAGIAILALTGLTLLSIRKMWKRKDLPANS